MKGKLLKTLVLAAVLTLVVGAGQAMAQGTTFQVSANVVRSCAISATNLAFGDYDPLATAAIDQTSSITVQCTKNTLTHIALGGVDQMAGGGNTLSYALFQDASRSTVWGTGGDRRDWTAPSKDPVTLTVYGRLAAGQDVPAGSYTDTVTAEIQF